VTLRYGQRYASFHAANAKKAEFSDVLREAIERSSGLKLRIDVTIDGADERRRPVPPSLTPDDARTPVLDDPPASPAADPSEEEAEVREAEFNGGNGAVIDVDELLATELDAELVQEQPPPER
jgi:DNA polymerase III subunit gamma/tau